MCPKVCGRVQKVTSSPRTSGELTPPRAQMVFIVNPFFLKASSPDRCQFITLFGCSDLEPQKVSHDFFFVSPHMHWYSPTQHNTTRGNGPRCVESVALVLQQHQSRRDSDDTCASHTSSEPDHAAAAAAAMGEKSLPAELRRVKVVICPQLWNETF